MKINHPVTPDADASESLPQNVEVSAVTMDQDIDVLARLRDRFGVGPTI